jgi:proteasome lid subunit RPN8/RPN11
MTLEILSNQWDVVRAHLDRAYPQEGCGVLLGVDGPRARRVTRAVPLENRHPEPARRYAIEPEAFLAAEKRARDLGLEVVGFYHSHPDGVPEPSRTDLDEAWPFYSYLIAGVGPEGVGEARAFRLDPGAGRFAADPLETV